MRKKRLKSILTTGIISMLSLSMMITSAYAAGPTIQNTVENKLQVASSGRTPLAPIATINPNLSMAGILMNDGKDSTHKTAFTLHDPYGIFEVPPKGAIPDDIRATVESWRTKNDYYGKTIKFNDDETYTLIKNTFKINGKWYHQKTIFRQINNQMSIGFDGRFISYGADYFSDYPSINGVSTGRADKHGWGETKVDIQLIDDDGNKLVMPEMLMDINDINYFRGQPREAFQIEGYRPTAGNVFMLKSWPYVLQPDGFTITDTVESSEDRPIFLKGTGIETGEVRNVWYGTPKGVRNGGFWAGSFFYTPSITVKYKSADSFGKITSTDGSNVNSFKTEVYYGASAANSKMVPEDGYKAKYWTVDRKVVANDGTEYNIGQEIPADKLSSIITKEDGTTFTAHFEQKKGGITITKTVKAPGEQNGGLNADN